MIAIFIEPPNNNDDEFIPRDAPLAVFSFVGSTISDGEYAHIAFRFAKQCGADFYMKETEDSYSFHFYFKKTLVLGTYALDWAQLVSECDSQSFTVYCALPQIIKATFYRTKRKKSDS